MSSFYLIISLIMSMEKSPFLTLLILPIYIIKANKFFLLKIFSPAISPCSIKTTAAAKENCDLHI